MVALHPKNILNMIVEENTRVSIIKAIIGSLLGLIISVSQIFNKFSSVSLRRAIL